MKKNTDIQTIMVNGTEEKIINLSTKQLIQYLDDLPHWDYDEVEPIMDELCDRLGLSLEDYEYPEDCYDAILVGH